MQMASISILKNGLAVLVNEFIPPEIIPLVWFSCIAVTVYVFFRVFSSTLREKFKQTNLSRRQAEKGGNTDGQIDDLISNAPRILNEINKQITAQKSQGVTDDQMSGLYRKKQMLELVTNNQEVINMIGKPIIKKLLGVVKSL